MAAEKQKSRQPPPKSRPRNPLNVVVEKVGATRAMVHGDVSVESLKELLMSSLSLLQPTTEVPDSEKDSKKSGARDWEMKLNDQEEEEEEDEDGLGPTPKDIAKDKLTVISDDTEDRRSAKSKMTRIDDGMEESAAEKNGDKRKSKKKIGEKQRASGTEAGLKPESRRANDNENESAEEKEEEEDTTESLPSCLSVFSIEGSPFSNDGRWLRRNFEKPLVQGLKDVVKNKPQDPVGYLAIWLRRYRYDEEVRRRRTDFDNELKAERLFVTNRATDRKELNENVEPDCFGDDEEGGGNADWNFKNYRPGSADRTEAL